MVLAAALRVHCQYGPGSRGGSARQAQLRWPQRVRRSVIEAGSTMPDRAMAASSAAIFLASAWWLAATRTARPSEPSAVNHRPRTIAPALVALVPAGPGRGVPGPARAGGRTQGRGPAR